MLLKKQPELLFIQIIDLQISLRNFELLFINLQDLDDTIQSLQKCINGANTLLSSDIASDIEQSELKDSTIKKAKKPFDRVMNIISVANMLCDSLKDHGIADVNPQYLREIITKINKIKKGSYVHADKATDLDFIIIYSLIVDYIFSNNTLCFDALEKINNKLSNYTRSTFFDLHQKTVETAEVMFLLVGMKFIIEKIDTVIETIINSCFTPQNLGHSDNETTQQGKNTYSTDHYYDMNSNDIYGISTKYCSYSDLSSLNIDPPEEQKTTTAHNAETGNSTLHTRKKRNAYSITDAIPLSNEIILAYAVTEVNNDNNNAFINIENNDSTDSIIQYTSNDLINKVNKVTKHDIKKYLCYNRR